MDDYINKKRKSLIQSKTVKNDVVIETQQQIVVRQSDQQLKTLFPKIEFIEKSIAGIKQKFKQLQYKRLQLSEHHKSILGESSVQKSQIKDKLSDGQTPKSNQIIQSTKKLALTEKMASKLNVQSTKRQSANTADEKLQQPSNQTRKLRKIR